MRNIYFLIFLSNKEIYLYNYDEYQTHPQNIKFLLKLVVHEYEGLRST